MAKSYTKKEIITKIDEAISRNKPIYKEPCLNYRQALKDCQMETTEVIAEHLVKLLSANDSHRNLFGITKITREKKSYKIDHHHKKEQDSSNRNEEWTAIRLVRSGYTNKEYGTMEDYQVPLKNKQEDLGVGKIDLVSYHKESNKFYIHELKVRPMDKKSSAEESLLRAALEIYSYFLTVDKEKLLLDFEHPGARIIPSVLAFPNSRPYTEFTNRNEYPHVHAFMNTLGVKFHLSEETTNGNN